ncbi:MAG: NAD(P)/FAD-dependent oxidoreductase [Candidatus Eiseniibacteriota bacterium]
MDARPHVVIVGAGFAGLYAAKILRKAPVRITVIDRRNHHLFQPLLYQVATAGLNPADIAAPIRSILRGGDVSVVLGEAVAVDVERKRVLLSDAEVPYDWVIVATGATHSYFGHEDWRSVAPGLKSIEDALEIRGRVFLAYERAERESDPAARAAWMTFVLVGAGPTGVEMAGAFCEIAHHAMVREFRNIDPNEARVVLLEGQDRVLPLYPPDLSARARRQLEALGAEVRTGALVTAIDEQGVIAQGERIAARTVVWAAGVQASPLARTLGVPLDRAGRVLVTPELTVPGRSDVFVVGDLAAREQDGTPVPGTCPAAIQEGRHAARNVLRAFRGRPLVPFHWLDKGEFATIGRHAAVGRLRGGGRLWGAPAWLAWLVIHLYFLIGFRNRLLVLIQWAWSYVTFRRGARLITGRPPAGP